jgi:hypothetical protein
VRCFARLVFTKNDLSRRTVQQVRQIMAPSPQTVEAGRLRSKPPVPGGSWHTTRDSGRSSRKAGWGDSGSRSRTQFSKIFRKYPLVRVCLWRRARVSRQDSVLPKGLESNRGFEVAVRDSSRHPRALHNLLHTCCSPTPRNALRHAPKSLNTQQHAFQTDLLK